MVAEPGGTGGGTLPAALQQRLGLFGREAVSGRADLVIGVGPIPGMLIAIGFLQRRAIAASCLVNPLVPALEADSLAAADAVHEFADVVIAVRAAGLPATPDVVLVGVTATAGATIGATPLTGVPAVITAMAAALAISTAALAITATIFGDGCVPAQ